MTKRHTHITVEVTLSEREYRHLRSMASMTAEGTVAAAIRSELFQSENPYGASTNPTVLSEGEYVAQYIRSF